MPAVIFLFLFSYDLIPTANGQSQIREMIQMLHVYQMTMAPKFMKKFFFFFFRIEQNQVNFRASEVYKP